jgi:hypothetical protein
MSSDAITADTLAGMLRKAARVVERAAKHPAFGSQRLWDTSAAIKDEAKRILEIERVSCSDNVARGDPPWRT